MNSPLPLSACLITKDEADRLPACLAALSFCDEIVVVDSGSTDGTREVARAHGARVLERDWPGMLEQKRRAVDAATYDWVLSVDADEVVSEELRASIQAILGAGGTPPDAAAYALRWENRYLGGPVRSDQGRGLWKVRLFDRRRGRWEGLEPHGHVRVDGSVGRLAGALHHRPYRDLAHVVQKTNAYTTAAAEALLETRRSPLAGMLVRAPWAFLRSYVFRGGFRDGGRGFVVAGLAAWYVFLRSVKLAELRRER